MSVAIVYGNPADGFAVVGPFATAERANDWAASLRTDWWALELVPSLSLPRERTGSPQVVFFGDLSKGFRLVGPFAGRSAARAWKHSLPPQERRLAWVVPLQAEQDVLT